MQINNKVFVVTGAGGGIGSELALGLLKKGAKVAAVDLREESLNQLKEAANNDGLATFGLNITDRKSVEDLPKRIIDIFGQVDAVINNAGIIQPFVKVNDLSFEDIERVMNVNFYGMLNVTKNFLPYLLDRPEAYLVNVSSMGGFLPVPGQSVYGASKAAIKLMTEGLYGELVGTNVKVSVVFPGAINTNITKNSGVAVPVAAAKSQNIRMTSPKDAAKIIIKGIEKEKYQIFIGRDSKMMNLMYRLNPKFATNLIAKQMESLLG